MRSNFKGSRQVIEQPEQVYEHLVTWIYNTAKKNRSPGLMVGISGTDSILTFLACAEAMKRLGKPERVIVVNFGVTPRKTEDVTKLPAQSCSLTQEFNWVAEEIFPWLKQKAPEAGLEILNSFNHHDDNLRWGYLHSRAVEDTAKQADLHRDHFFVVGTRNATEDYIGNYSLASMSVSMLPIVNLLKSEVLMLCEYLGVPAIALEKSRQIDCACGRYDIAANNIEEVDAWVLHEQGLISDAEYETIPEDIRLDVEAYAFEERNLNKFRKLVPFKPSALERS